MVPLQTSIQCVSKLSVEDKIKIQILNTPHTDQLIQHNSNLQYISELKNITANTTAKDLTEAQKLAFQALMRIAHDPSGKVWSKRVEKLDRQRAARLEAESKMKMERQEAATIKAESKRKQTANKQKQKESLKKKIKRMRTERRFPLPPEKRNEDPARRYGFIPRSQKKENLADYVKVWGKDVISRYKAVE